MDRRRFLQMCALMGIAGPPIGCASDAAFDEGEFDGTVLIVGAGAAGMSAGYLLAQQGIDFTIVEAAPTYGGRIRRTLDFVDFPIPLGGEWLHAGQDELAKIVNDSAVEIPTKIIAYDSTDVGVHYEDGELSSYDLSDETDLKFVGSSWLDFFDELIVPTIADRMTFDTPIQRIDHSGDEVVATDASGAERTADAVIVTVPITILRDGDIEFVPPLPTAKIEALQQARIWGGMKVFIEFDEAFYPTYVSFADSATNEGQRLYYDAAYGQDSDAHVLGLFSVGAQAEPYQRLAGDDLRDHVLAELDEIFDGAATRHYVQHLAQNWNEEPFIRQAYLADNALSATSRRLAEPIDGRVFFAGDAYTKFDGWSEVHLAARSARDAVATLLG